VHPDADGGNIDIRADTVSIRGAGQITSESELTGAARAGTVSIRAASKLEIDNGSIAARVPIQEAVTLGYAGYVMDDYKVNKNLTLNLGLRYELLPPPVEVANRFMNFDNRTGKVLIAGFNTDKHLGIQTQYKLFSPRFGFAYQLSSNTVIRGGFGIFYNTAGNGGAVLRLQRHVPFGPIYSFSPGNFIVSRRVSDGRLLGLIKSWLEAPVEEVDARGRKHRTTRNKNEGRGTPQGAPLSPLLANLYMRRFVLGWKVQGHERRLDAHIVNYADDFVICCRGTADEAMTVMRDMMAKLKLTVNETKTQLCRVPEETFDFLGYTFGRLYSPRTGDSYLGMRPSAKKIQAICAALSEQTERRWLFLDPEEVVGRLNRMLRGWANYFCRCAVSAAYRIVDSHACFRLRQWLGRRERVQGSSRSRYSEPYLRRTYGLVQLVGRPRPPSRANA
jgi:hypothetical protein